MRAQASTRAQAFSYCIVSFFIIYNVLWDLYRRLGFPSPSHRPSHKHTNDPPPGADADVLSSRVRVPT